MLTLEGTERARVACYLEGTHRTFTVLFEMGKVLTKYNTKTRVAESVQPKLHTDMAILDVSPERFMTGWKIPGVIVMPAGATWDSFFQNYTATTSSDRRTKESPHTTSLQFWLNAKKGMHEDELQKRMRAAEAEIKVLKAIKLMCEE